VIAFLERIVIVTGRELILETDMLVGNHEVSKKSFCNVEL